MGVLRDTIHRIDDHGRGGIGLRARGGVVGRDPCQRGAAARCPAAAPGCRLGKTSGIPRHSICETGLIEKFSIVKPGNPTLIVTGSSGLIGSALIERVGSRFVEMALDREGPPHPPPESEVVISCDLSSDESVTAALDQVR